ncbi:MAG TPA: hypothetical protein PLB99_12945, partial [Thermotogota bacterium]|nr:hypothetical protein [Thermotogota bacterium]
MKKAIIITLLLIMATVNFAEFSLGASVGLPGKITAKYQFNDTFGIDLSAAFLTAFSYTVFNTNTDLLFYSLDIAVNDNISVDGYWGIGTGITFPGSFDSLMLSLRGPLGIEFPVEFFEDKKCAIFFEVVPLVYVFPLPALTFT